LEQRTLWARLKKGIRECLSEEEWAQEAHGRALPEPAAASSLAGKVARAAAYAQSKEQRTRIQAWEERTEQDWAHTRTSTYKWLRDDYHPKAGFMVMGDGSLSGNLMAMQQEAQEQWCSKVYCDPKRVAPDIQAAIDKHDGMLRRHRKEHLLHPLTGAALAETLKQWSRSKAGGTDGWEAALFRDIPLFMLDRLAEFYGLVELGAPWPRALVEGLMALVPKKATAGGALEQRPITLTNLGYRLWSGTRCRESSSWLRAWAHPCSGGGPGRGPELVWGPIALRAEAAKSTGDPLGGFRRTCGSTTTSSRRKLPWGFWNPWASHPEWLSP
jgi:hypothetical protein